jgi:hypothetical protein
MKELVKHQKYSIQPKSFKLFKARMRQLRQDLLELKWYWKKRCVERQGLARVLTRSRLVLERLERQEKNFSSLFNRNHFAVLPSGKGKRSKEPYYVLMLTAQDIQRLRQFLKKRR